MENQTPKIDAKTVDEVGRLLDDALKHSGRALKKADKQGPIPPEPLRWFVVAYVISLAVSAPTTESHWIQSVGYFTACLMGLVGIYRINTQRTWFSGSEAAHSRVVQFRRKPEINK